MKNDDPTCDAAAMRQFERGVVAGSAMRRMVPGDAIG